MRISFGLITLRKKREGIVLSVYEDVLEFSSLENIEYYKNLSGRFERKLDRITIRIFFELIFWERRIDN